MMHNWTTLDIFMTDKFRTFLFNNCYDWSAQREVAFLKIGRPTTQKFAMNMFY